MDLSVVIASYNTRDTTRHCLNKIINQTAGLEYEIIVVDNGSTDGSVQMIEKDFPSVQLIYQKDNLGFAAAQNIGLLQARGEYLLILNSDVLFVGNAAAYLVDYMRSESADLGVVGPQILNPDGTVAPSARRAMLSVPMIVIGIVNRHFKIKRFLPIEVRLRKNMGFLLARWHDNYGQHDAVRQVEYVDGMCVLVKREVLERVGLFDEQFFFDQEIVDLSNRIRQHGWKIKFFPGAQVIHLLHSSRKKISRILVETHRSELIYYAKYAPDIVSLVRKFNWAVVAFKLLLLKVSLFFSGVGDPRHDLVAMYQEILDLCRHFEATSIFANERIPLLKPNRQKLRTDLK